MAEGSTDDTLPIRCPSCAQRFKVGPELMGRMVECGTCEHRFRVNEEVLVRTKRHYPGDRKDTHLERFSRVPMASTLNPASFQQAQYSPSPPPPLLTMGPTSPLRLICGLLAGVVFVGIALLLAFGSSPGGMMDGADQTKRLMLGIFGAVISAALLLVANPKARGRALLFAAVVSAILISLPFLVKSRDAKGRNGSPLPQDELTSLINRDNNKPAPEEDPLADLKKEIGTQPLDTQIARTSGTPGKAAAGIWLRDLKEYHKAQIANYIIRTANADLTSHMYPRDQDYLMVVTGVTDDLNELAKMCERFGEVKRIIPQLRVIEVGIKNEAFQEGPLDKLSDPKNPAFYDLNRRELESIDLERCRNAVQRLISAEPLSYRPDIVKRMQQLLPEGDFDMKGQIADALETWSQPGDGSLEAVRTVAQHIRDQNTEMPESIIAFLAKRKDLAAIPMVDQLWVQDSTKWENPYADLGPAVEPLLLKRFPDTTPTLKMSAARILGKAGTAKSIPVLEAARPSATGELKGLIDAAVASIRSRG